MRPELQKIIDQNQPEKALPNPSEIQNQYFLAVLLKYQLIKRNLYNLKESNGTDLENK